MQPATPAATGCPRLADELVEVTEVEGLPQLDLDPVFFQSKQHAPATTNRRTREGLEFQPHLGNQTTVPRRHPDLAEQPAQ